MRRRLAAASLALALVAPACGGGEGPEQAATTTAEAAPAALAADAPTSSTPTTAAPATTTAAPATTPATTPSAGATKVAPLPTPAPPASPQAAAAELARVEVALRDPRTPAADLPALALSQQVVYRHLAENPTWRAAALAALPAGVRPIAEQNVQAVSLLLSMITKPKTTLPAWRIQAPPPADELLALYKAAGAQMGIDWTVLAAIHLVETRMGRIRGVSTAGARGPMQFMPATFAQYGAGGDIESPRDAIFAAARMLKRNGLDRDPRAAVHTYNRSFKYVDAVLAHASLIRADERAYLGYHGWQVFYRTASGDHLLPEGWSGA